MSSPHDEVEEKMKEKEKETARKTINKRFVLDETLIPQSIDHAMGSIEINNEKFRYYGSSLLQSVSKMSKEGKPFEVTEKAPAIILEDGRIISECNKVEGLNFEFETRMSLKKNRWSLKSINSFVHRKYDAVTFKDVHLAFVANYKHAMVYEDQEWYDIHALYDHLSYFQDVIDKAVIIKQEGLSGTAKSKTAKISANQGFNGRKFLKPTCASFFRYRSQNKSLIIIEEAERLFDKNLNNSNDNELVEYLNGSYEKGSFVPRQSEKDRNITEEFDPFGLTRICSIKPLRGALKKRSITNYQVKAKIGDKRGDIEIPTEMNKGYQNVRNMAYISGLTNYKQFVKNLKEVENKYGLQNRQWAVAKPLIALASCIDDELKDKIGFFMAKQFLIRDSNFDESSWLVQLSYVLIETFCVSRDKMYISRNQLATLLGEKLGTEFTTNKTTRMLEELSLGTFFGPNKTKTERGIIVDFFKIIEILLRNNILTLEIVLMKVSEVSNCPYSDEEITKWYTDTFKDTSKSKVSKGTVQGDRTLSEGIREVNLDKEEAIEDIPQPNEKELINHHCSICNETPCVDWDPKGKPVCLDCFKGLKVQKDVVK